MVTWSLTWLTPPRQPAMGWAYSARMVGPFGQISWQVSAHFLGVFGPFSYTKFGAIFFYVGHFGYIVFNNFFCARPTSFYNGLCPLCTSCWVGLVNCSINTHKQKYIHIIKYILIFKSHVAVKYIEYYITCSCQSSNRSITTECLIKPK
jgi:hypothetical protein